MPLGKFLNFLKGAIKKPSPDSLQTLESDDKPIAELLSNDIEIKEQKSENEFLSPPILETNSDNSEPNAPITSFTVEAALTADSVDAEIFLVNEFELSTAKEANSQTISSTILEKKIMINVSMLQDSLQNFVSGTPDIQGAILASPDGLALASVLPGAMDEERTAAMSASMLSIGERIGRELARGNVDRIVVEGEKGYGVLVGCGSDAVLLVLAGAGVKQGLLFLEVKRAVAKISPLLG